MEPHEKLNRDYVAFNLAVAERAQEEIKKIRLDVEAIRAQAAKVGESLMIVSQVSEKPS